MQLSPSAKQALMAYSWPGNVREWIMLCSGALILQTGSVIEDKDLGLQMFTNVAAKPALMEFGRAHQEFNRPQSAADIPVSFTAPRAKLWASDGTIVKWRGWAAICASVNMKSLWNIKKSMVARKIRQTA